MQNLNHDSRDMFEFYSNILVSMSPDWIADKGGGISEIQHLTENNYERTVLKFDQFNSKGEKTLPMIIIELLFRENNIDSKHHLSIYKKNLLCWDVEVYFPL